MAEMTRRPRRTHVARSTAFVSTSSIASTTKSRPPPSSSSAVCLVSMRLRASTVTKGATPRMASRIVDALGVPTSFNAATACRFSDDSDTWSKSTIRRYATPARASIIAVCDPTPPRPKMHTRALRMLRWFADPKKASCRESISQTTCGGSDGSSDASASSASLSDWSETCCRRSSSDRRAPSRSTRTHRDHHLLFLLAVSRMP
mmetsp:Transcript_9793/g.32257  ORF Transcript_9793/g.32257 Transcript_9793/m.32257 type:complete len:204 (-) Transcript_9793:141-752(-)